MKKRRSVLSAAAFLLAVLLTGCAGNGKKKDVITLTLWHVYGGQTDSPLNDVIEHFNETAGKQEGIRVHVTSVSNTNTIHEAVLAAARKEPGAAALPDLFVSYPKTVLALPDPDILVDYGDYFSEEELRGYIPEFLQEGRVNGRLSVFPVAKSTEILFVNQTFFDRFAAETGADERELATWEGCFVLQSSMLSGRTPRRRTFRETEKPFLPTIITSTIFRWGVNHWGKIFLKKRIPRGAWRLALCFIGCGSLMQMRLSPTEFGCERGMPRSRFAPETPL